jgi:hypothetical protein
MTMRSRFINVKTIQDGNINFENLPANLPHRQNKTAAPEDRSGG